MRRAAPGPESRQSGQRWPLELAHLEIHPVRGSLERIERDRLAADDPHPVRDRAHRIGPLQQAGAPHADGDVLSLLQDAHVITRGESHVHLERPTRIDVWREQRGRPDAVAERHDRQGARGKQQDAGPHRRDGEVAASRAHQRQVVARLKRRDHLVIQLERRRSYLGAVYVAGLQREPTALDAQAGTQSHQAPPDDGVGVFGQRGCA